MTVAIITDTVCCLEQELIDELDINLIPVYMTINGKEYKDRVTLSPEDFWKLFPDIKEYSTSAPPVAEYLQLYERLSKNTKEIACIFVSQSLSATTEAALLARQIFQKDNPDVKIEIIDSRIAAGSQGFMVLEMAQAAKAGKSLAEIVKIANDMIPQSRLLVALEGLKRLIKIGRAPKTAYLGELFQVKPLIGLVNNTGLVENLGKSRGTEKAMLKMADMIETYISREQPVRIAIHYTDSIEEGRRLENIILPRFNVTEYHFTPFSSVICLAIGPSTCVAFYPESEEKNR